jgi:hypothetical protein
MTGADQLGRLQNGESFRPPRWPCWIRQAVAILISVLVLWVVSWDESIASSFTDPTENKAASDLGGVLVDNCAPEEALAECSCGGCEPFFFGHDFKVEGAKLPRGKVNSPQVVVPSRSNGSATKGTARKLKGAFGNCAGISPSVHEGEHDRIISRYFSPVHILHCPERLTHSQFGSMRGVELFASQSKRLHSAGAFIFDQSQLPYEKSGLQPGYEGQSACEHGQPERVSGNSFRFESELIIDRRFLLAVTLIFCGLLICASSGLYFYRERYLIGASLIGAGWLCCLGAWSITAGSALLWL